jgi:hypothetical protein
MKAHILTKTLNQLLLATSPEARAICRNAKNVYSQRIRARYCLGNLCNGLSGRVVVSQVYDECVILLAKPL